jgi:hypothetical protein
MRGADTVAVANTIKIAALLGCLSGCSFISVLGPHEPGTSGPLGCTDSLEAPVADTVFAIAGVVGGVGIMSIHPQDPYSDIFKYPAGGVVIGIGVVYAVSAVVGYSRVTRCREANARARRASSLTELPPRSRLATINNCAELRTEPQ